MVYGGFGISLILTAVGAVLAWAVNVEAEGFNLNTIGIILFVVGLIGLLLSVAGLGFFRDREVVHTTTEPRRDVTVIER